MSNSKNNQNAQIFAGALIHPHDELPAEPTGALIVELIDNQEPMLVRVTDYTGSGWDDQPKEHQYWIAEDDLFQLLPINPSK